jgi:hypothetical protein
VAEPFLDAPRVVARVSQGVPAGMPQHVCSVANTKAEPGNCRRSSCRARTSSPRSGCALGLPFWRDARAASRRGRTRLATIRGWRSRLPAGRGGRQ